jgi:hypothetical protein
MELLIEVCKLVILADIVVLSFLAIIYFYCAHNETGYASSKVYEAAKTAAVSCLVLQIAFLLLGCTPKKKCILGLEEFHVASITINGEKTETDFLLR